MCTGTDFCGYAQLSHGGLPSFNQIVLHCNLPGGRLLENFIVSVSRPPAIAPPRPGYHRQQEPAQIRAAETPRQKTHDLSEIVNNKGKVAGTCVVHDLSRKGAMLEVSISDLPTRFILTNHIRRSKVACRVVWRCGSLAGVEFLTNPRDI